MVIRGDYVKALYNLGVGPSLARLESARLVTSIEKKSKKLGWGAARGQLARLAREPKTSQT